MQEIYKKFIAVGGVVTRMENREKSGNFIVVRENRKNQGKCFLAWTAFAQLILTKINEIVATRCRILRLKCIIFHFRCGSTPGLAMGGYGIPQTP